MDGVEELEERELTLNEFEDELEERDLPIDDALLEDAIERQRADDIYEQEHTRTTRIEKTKNVLGTIPTLGKDLAGAFTADAEIPETATVTSVKGHEDGSRITIEAESEADIESQTQNETFDISDDKEKLDFLLSKAEAKRPSELEGKEIPIKPEIERKRSGKRGFSFHTPKNRKGHLIPYYTKRILYKLNGYSLSEGNRGKYHYWLNRNGALTLGGPVASIGVALLLAGNLLAANKLLFFLFGGLGVLIGGVGGLLLLGYVLTVLNELLGKMVSFLFGTD